MAVVLDSNRVPLEPGILAAVNPFEDARPARDPLRSRCQSYLHHYWHVLVPSVQPAQLFGYRVHGPPDPANGLRFDSYSSKFLLDPYGHGVVTPYMGNVSP